MPINAPGPFEVEYTYLTTINSLTLTHVMRVNCLAIDDPEIGTPMADIDFMSKAGTPVDAMVSIADLWDWVRLQLNTGVTCSGAVLYKYVTGTLSKDFIAAYPTSLPAGVNGAGSGDSHQMTQSYITGAGGIMKLTILEDVNGSLQNRATLISNAAGSDDQKLAAYILSADGWIIGRDDAFPVAPKNQSFGQNEATFKARHR